MLVWHRQAAAKVDRASPSLISNVEVEPGVNSSKRNIFVGGGEMICDPVADPVTSKVPILGKLGGKNTSQIRGFLLALPQLSSFLLKSLSSPHRFHSLDCISCRQEAVVKTAVQSTCRGAVTGGAVGQAQQICGTLAEVQVPDVPFADLGKSFEYLENSQ